MADIGKVQYRVTPLVRFQVTRYHETVGGKTGGNEQKGIYDNADVAYEVAYALCKEEHARLGFPLGDGRVQYPRNIYDSNILGDANDGAGDDPSEWRNSNLNANNPNAITLATAGMLKSRG